MNITQKQKKMLNIMSKNLDIVRESIVKFSEPYEIGKNMLFLFLICSKKTIYI